MLIYFILNNMVERKCWYQIVVHLFSISKWIDIIFGFFPFWLENDTTYFRGSP